MKTSIIELMDRREDLRDYLYIHGFLVTDNTLINQDGFPFYNRWKMYHLSKNYCIYAHPKTGVSILEKERGFFVLLGHAFDPYNQMYKEIDILENLAKHYKTKKFREIIDGLTGLYVFFVINEDNIEFEVDATGLQQACHAKINGSFYLVSHAQILGDLFQLEMSKIVKDLVNYKWYYRIKGTYLPCDLSPYEGILRVIPNIVYTYDGVQVLHKRIFPIKEPKEAKMESEYERIIKDGACFLKNSMELIAKKWAKPYISLTGGIDSNTTFAAANGLYDKFGTFTYVSSQKEEIDAEAAKKISDFFHINHRRLDVPEDKALLKDYDEYVQIMKHNSGYVTNRFENEYRKRVYLIHNLKDIDLEIKSWSSEAIRGYLYNHFERRTMPKCTAKVYRNCYKLFFLNRRLARDIDLLFEEYMKKYDYYKIPESLLYDMFYVEISMGSWGAYNLSELRMYSEVTSIYNNRRFLAKMFEAPIEKRIASQNHLDMKAVLNEELYNMNIRVVNSNETSIRAKFLNIIFKINNWLPF